MTYPVLPSKLYLLVPWDLPIQQQLSDIDNVKLQRSLKQFLKALEQHSVQEAIAIIHQELAYLDISAVVPIQLSSTQTPLNAWEVEDFDSYFEVTHVQTQEPAVCMVWSLLVAYQVFLVLSDRGSDFDQTQVEQQRQGFKGYVYLLARVFNLNLE
ncbi:MAG TPA: hypothetical protein V6C84_21175 [Coleofasciculaceae cyanobacterium]|jgi:hypothetical protein